MRVLAIYRHYWPDTTPYARILKSILERLAQEGHDVTVLSGQPSYNDIAHARQPWNEQLGGVHVRRFCLLPERKRFRLLWLVNFAYFLTRAVVFAMTARRYDVVIANSHPPLLMGWALRLIRRLRGTPFIYHCQDLHPESARAGSKLRSNWLYRLLRSSDAATCRLAQRVVVLSEDMLEAVRDRGVGPAQLAIINNPPLPLGETKEIEHCDLPEGFRVIFAGNLGEFQELDLMLEGARRVSADIPLRVIFLGEGLAKRRLIEKAGKDLNKRFFFLPHQSVEAAHEAMSRSDLGVVSLLPDVYKYAFPSKSMMYLSAGCPLFTIIEEDSELARTVRGFGLGLAVKERSPDAIARKLERAYRERADWSASRRRALQRIGDALYGQSTMLQVWSELVNDTPAVQSTHRHHIKAVTSMLETAQIAWFPFERRSSHSPLLARVHGLCWTDRFLKRTVDILASTLGLLATGWLILIAAALARWDTGASGFFSQLRVGRHGQRFRIYKIRTMLELDGHGTTVATSQDPRITPLGRLLRKTKIDKLPQLWNVLKGDMSLVGPRPDVPELVDQLQGLDLLVMTVRPGITGPASLKYRDEEQQLACQPDPDRYNGEVIYPDKTRLNRMYIQQYRLRNDFKCLWMTLAGVDWVEGEAVLESTGESQRADETDCPVSVPLPSRFETPYRRAA